MSEFPRLSAHSLRQFDLCPRKFALAYKAARYWPGGERAVRRDASDPLELGAAFHQLVQWRASGLDVDALVAAWAAELPELLGLWRAWAESPHAEAEGAVWTEQPLAFFWGGAPFLVRYDRLVKRGEHWTIVDWKTGRVDEKKLLGDWQSRLYPFALAEAGAVLNGGTAIAPEAVTLVYWEVSTGRSLTVAHDAAQHEAVRGALVEAASRALAPFDERLADDTTFPRNTAHCSRCSFDAFCNREAALVNTAPVLPQPRFVV